MLSEGTTTKTALELADALDYYGAYFQTRGSSDDATASLYCLEKHLKKCLPLFIEAIVDSIFPEKELDIIKRNSIQKLIVNEKKNSYLLRKNFYQNLLGINHPYAFFSEKVDIENISVSDLKLFYQNNYLEGLKYLLLSGKFSNETLYFIQESISASILQNRLTNSLIPAITSSFGNHFIEKKDAVQCAIRIGKLSILRSHPDFRKLQLLNLIFGGYFGSRLMKNIREEKGLTYGIYAALETYKNASVWYIDTEMNNKNRQSGVDEIYKEMKLLGTQLIGKEELEIAKNFLLGSFLRSLDGPFSLADRFKILIDNNLSKEYYTEFVKIINQISSEELLEIANIYLKQDKLVEVIVGKS
ncbi:MAG: insulinase family protein [Flavobacterium sp.]|nr:insulinase family protein [Pedobacter sp.]